MPTTLPIRWVRRGESGCCWSRSRFLRSKLCWLLGSSIQQAMTANVEPLVLTVLNAYNNDLEISSRSLSHYSTCGFDARRSRRRAIPSRDGSCCRRPNLTQASLTGANRVPLCAGKNFLGNEKSTSLTVSGICSMMFHKIRFVMSTWNRPGIRRNR